MTYKLFNWEHELFYSILFPTNKNLVIFRNVTTITTMLCPYVYDSFLSHSEHNIPNLISELDIMQKRNEHVIQYIISLPIPEKNYI